jgi:hypothetical protein
MPVASKTLADNQTVSVTVTGMNPAGNLTTQSTAFAGVNKAVNIPPKSTNEEGNQRKLLQLQHNQVVRQAIRCLVLKQCLSC